MRFENIVFERGHELRFRYESVVSQPLHWKNAITILWLLSGELKIMMETESYTIREGEIEVINSDEMYALQGSKGNRVIVLEVRPEFFQKYYEEAADLFYYTNLPDDDIWDLRYEELRRFIATLLFEYIQELDDKEEQMDQTLLEMMYHLLNHFHYLYYDEESLKEDETERDRFHRVIKYLYHNYDSKVSLQDLADAEFLSAPYLSTQMKEYFGQSFTDYLNQIRCEESTKLLLDSDKNITQIALEVGFSHVRYYNKHFKLHYGISPKEYRERYSMELSEYREKTEVSALDLHEALVEVEGYLWDYERYSSDRSIRRINLDLSKEAEEGVLRSKMIYIDHPGLLLETEGQALLTEAIREIGFQTVLIDQLFTQEMGIQSKIHPEQISWRRVEKSLDFLLSVGLTPLILHGKREQRIVQAFQQYFTGRYSEEEIELWLDAKRGKASKKLLAPKRDPLFDTMAMVPYLFHRWLMKKDNQIYALVDPSEMGWNLSSDTFIGGNGIYTMNGLKKPLYFAHQLMRMAKGKIHSIGEGFVLLKNRRGYSLLLYNPRGIDEQGEMIPGMGEIRFSVNLRHLNQTYRVFSYALNSKNGSTYDLWRKMGSPEKMDRSLIELLKECRLGIDGQEAKPEPVYNILAHIPKDGCLLVQFEELNASEPII